MSHFAVCRCFIDGYTLVFLVILRVPANQTDRLLVVYAEQLEPLPVGVTQVLRLFLQGVSQALKHQIMRQLIQGKHLLADWTRLASFLCPPFLDAVFAEAVTAQ